MLKENPIKERLHLDRYLLDASWSNTSIVIVGLMLQNTPEEYQEELAVLIKETIQGLNEEQALMVLKAFPQYPTQRQIDGFLKLCEMINI